MKPVGIMQGRLSPPRGGRIQSFPVETWPDEFDRAREAGLACIEWIYEAETEDVNPLRTDAGIGDVRRAIERSGVVVWSVCGDYYMSERLVSPHGVPRPEIADHLVWLVSRVQALGARYLVLPFVDSSGLKSSVEIEGAAEILKSTLPVAEKRGIELHLETDLPPAELLTLFQRLGHPRLRMNYDIGNAAALGHDPTEELTLVGGWLGSVHVKDRVLGGGTVPLGRGAADFPTCFRLILRAGFQGPFILQAAREEQVGEFELAKRNRRFIEVYLAELSAAG